MNVRIKVKNRVVRGRFVDNDKINLHRKRFHCTRTYAIHKRNTKSNGILFISNSLIIAVKKFFPMLTNRTYPKYRKINKNFWFFARKVEENDENQVKR